MPQSDGKIRMIVAHPGAIVRRGLASLLRAYRAPLIEPLEADTPSSLAAAISAFSPAAVFVTPAMLALTRHYFPRRALSTLFVALTDDADKDAHPQIDALFRSSLSLNSAMPEIEKLLDSLLAPDPAAIPCAEEAPRGDSENSSTRSQEAAESQKPELSSREKEIVGLVVRGLTNKEIAEKLYLSVHTVLTHRRNIARKLEIHSSTGLTIYAIVNHIVELSDIAPWGPVS